MQTSDLVQFRPTVCSTEYSEMSARTWPVVCQQWWRMVDVLVLCIRRNPFVVPTVLRPVCRCVMTLPAELGDTVDVRLSRCNFTVGCEDCWFDDDKVTSSSLLSSICSSHAEDSAELCAAVICLEVVFAVVD